MGAAVPDVISQEKTLHADEGVFQDRALPGTPMPVSLPATRFASGGRDAQTALALSGKGYFTNSSIGSLPASITSLVSTRVGTYHGLDSLALGHHLHILDACLPTR